MSAVDTETALDSPLDDNSIVEAPDTPTNADVSSFPARHETPVESATPATTHVDETGDVGTPLDELPCTTQSTLEPKQTDTLETQGLAPPPQAGEVTVSPVTVTDDPTRLYENQRATCRSIVRENMKKTIAAHRTTYRSYVETILVTEWKKVHPDQWEDYKAGTVVAFDVYDRAWFRKLVRKVEKGQRVEQ